MLYLKHNEYSLRILLSPVVVVVVVMDGGGGILTGPDIDKAVQQ